MKNRYIIIFILLILKGATVLSQGNINVYPPFWWENMKTNQLEIIIRGENISGLQPVITSKEVTLNKAIQPGNPNYLILDVSIKPSALKGFEIKLNSNKDKTVYTYWYELKQRSPNSSSRQGFNSSDVVYLVMPDRFANGDTTNDSRPELYEKHNRKNSAGRHGGDIKGVSEHLDYISQLGYTALWLNPVLENNQFSATYHGYAITDYYAVDARLGSNAEYVALADSCHKKGMKLIMDMVFNHAGTQNILLKDPPSVDWFNYWPEFTFSNYRGELISDPYASEVDYKKMSNGWFDTTMADFNQNNPHVLKYLTQNSIWWIEYAGLDGIRMDTYPYPDKSAMGEWAKTVMTEYPNFNIVGEVWITSPSYTSHWQQNSALPENQNSYLRSVTDFPLYYALCSALNEPDGWNEGWMRLYTVLSQDFLYSNPQDLLIFPDNHDLERFSTTIGGGINKFKLAMAFLLTTRGIPQIYYGTELMMESTPYHGHGSYRMDYPGGWKNDTVNAFTGKGLSPKQTEARDYLQKLLLWRKGKEVIHTGNLKHFLPQNNVYVYCRYNATESVIVILNKNTTVTQLDFTRFAECTKNFTSGMDVISGKTIKLNEPLELEPLTPMIIELK